MDDTTQPIGPPLPAPPPPDDPTFAPHRPGDPASTADLPGGPASASHRPGGPASTAHLRGDPVAVSLASRLLGMVLVGAAGLVLLLVGLAWDAVLHARDPGLAAEEGVFALSNPGHLLAGIGIALVAVGLAGALTDLVLQARGIRPRSTPARLGVAVAVVALALVAGGTGVWAAGAGGHDPDPAAAHDPASHVHDSANATEAGTSGDANGPETAEHTHGPNLPEVAAATDEERAKAEALWKASAASSERWRDPDAAAAAGFRFKDKDEAGPERRVRFLHVPNPAWRADGQVLDPARPETLIYWNGPGDRLTLVGVMYTADRGASGPAVGGPITRWHDHESCRDPDTRAKLGRPVDGACPEGQVYRRSGEMMHVWFTDDLATAFARRAPLAASAPPTPRGSAGKGRSGRRSSSWRSRGLRHPRR
jgi:hypothetical protein